MTAIASTYAASNQRRRPAVFQKNSASSIGYAACSDGTAAMGLANCPVPEKTCLPFDNPMCDHISSMILAVGCSLAVRLASHGGIAGYSA